MKNMKSKDVSLKKFLKIKYKIFRYKSLNKFVVD